MLAALSCSLLACNATDGPPGQDGGRGGSAGSAPAGSGGSVGPSCSPCIERTIEWGNDGGLVAFVERSSLRTCNGYRHERVPAAGGGEQRACERSVPCMGSGLHGVNDVLLALGHADVVNALRFGKILFGVDARPVDGQVFAIRIDGKLIEVGGTCPPASSSCRPTLPGVAALVERLRSIDEEQLALEPCAGVFER